MPHRLRQPSRPDSFSSNPRRLLIVEDNPTDRELVRYLLEARFVEARIYEAASLNAAMRIMSQEDIECVVLDLQLPDSTGKGTFNELHERYPGSAYIVMTHNKDRDLAIEMIQLGAADYVIKNFTDEEELFRRIMIAIEKHRYSVRVTPGDAASVQRLDRAQANLKSAHESGQHSAIRDTSVEVTAAMADLSRRMFAELQTLSNQMTQIGTTQTSMVKVVDNLDTELLRGQPGRSSMRSQVDLMEHRLTNLEAEVHEVRGKKEDAEKSKRTEEAQQRQEAVQLTQHRISMRTKVILGVIGLISTIAGTIATYEAARHKTPDLTPSAIPALSAAASGAPK